MGDVEDHRPLCIGREDHHSESHIKVKLWFGEIAVIDTVLFYRAEFPAKVFYQSTAFICTGCYLWLSGFAPSNVTSMMELRTLLLN